MAELIRKDKLIDWSYREPTYYDSMNDRTDMRDFINGLPTTTEAEIRNKAIDEFFDELQKAEALAELKSFPVNCLDFKEQMALDMAINALKKQIAKKPTEVDERMAEDYEEYYYLSFLCPSCRGSVTGQPYRPNYCKHCGQKLDWSEV